MTNLDLDISDFMRMGTITLCLVCLVAILVLNRGRNREGRATFGYAIKWLGVAGVLAAIVFGTLEVLLEWHTQIRAFVLFGSLVWLTVGLVWSIRHDKRRR